jgi:hypothetical protein
MQPWVSVGLLGWHKPHKASGAANTLSTRLERSSSVNIAPPPPDVACKEAGQDHQPPVHWDHPATSQTRVLVTS